MAASEKPLIDASLLAIQELNQDCDNLRPDSPPDPVQQCGIGGQRIEPIVRDTGSDWSKAAEIAQQMIMDDGVVSIFGCWTSACREAVVPVIERYKNILWYPVQYEGLVGRQRPAHVVFTGAAPNQQIFPAIAWANKQFSSVEKHAPTKFFLVGSNYVFPIRADRLISAQVEQLGGQVVGNDESIDLGSTDVKKVVERIVKANPDVIVNTINGDTNGAFFPELSLRLREAGEDPPVLSFSVAEAEIREIGLYSARHQFAAWNYFQSVNTPINSDFPSRFSQFVKTETPGTEVDPVTSDPIVSAYWQVRLFARAARLAGAVEPESILNAAAGMILDTPEGVVRIDPDNLHTWKRVLIGLVGNDGQFKIIKASPSPVRPAPFFDTEKKPFGLDHPGAIDDRIPQLVDVQGNRLPEPQHSKQPLDTLFDGQADWITQFDSARDAANLDATDAETLALRWRDIPDVEIRRYALSALCANKYLSARGQATVLSSMIVQTDLLLLAAGSGCAYRIAAAADQGAVSEDGPLIDKAIEGYLSQPDLLMTRATLHLLAYRPNDLSDGGFRDKLYLAMASLDPRFTRALINDLVSAIRGAVRLFPEGDASPASRPEMEFFVSLRDFFNSQDQQKADIAIHELETNIIGAKGSLWRRSMAYLRQHNATMIVMILALAWLVIFAFLYFVGLKWFPGPIYQLDQFLFQKAPELQRAGWWFQFLFTYNVGSNLLWVGLLARNQHVLDWWIRKNSRAIEEQFNEFRERSAAVLFKDSSAAADYKSIHFDLPVDDLGRKKRFEKVEELIIDLRSLHQNSRRTVVQITGEGGIGKTHLACQLALAGYRDSQRLFGDHIAMPLVINRLISNGRIDSIEEFLEQIKAQLKNAIGDRRLPDDRFVAELMLQQRLVVIVDDIVDTAGIDWRLPNVADFPANALIATSRIRQELGGRQNIELHLRPVPLDGVFGFVKRFTSPTSTDPDEAEEEQSLDMAMQIVRMFGSTRRKEEDKGIPAYFVKLYAVSQGKGNRIGKANDVFAFFENYLEFLMREIKTRGNGAAAVKRLAWLAVKQNGRAWEISVELAISELEKKFPKTNAAELLNEVVNRGLLHPAQPGEIKFGSDVFAEHLAILGLVQEMVSVSGDAHSREVLEKDAIEAIRKWERQDSDLGQLLLKCCEARTFQSDISPNFLEQLHLTLGRPAPIVVGVLFSTSGPMAISERRLVDATQIAIEQINVEGGIRGRTIKYINRDGASDENIFAEEARALIVQDKVVSIFGCWTSASRRKVKEVVEEHSNLLWYPLQYEGYERSKQIIYSGAAPNQQLMPALEFCIRTFGSPGLLIGSDYIFPRTANKIAKHMFAQMRLPEPLELYFDLKETHFSEAIDKISTIKPKFILNTINGESNLQFFSQLFNAGIRSGFNESNATPDGTAGNGVRVPVMSLSIAETEVRRIGSALLEGHYLAWSYFHQPETSSSRQFMELVKAKLGAGVVTDDPMESAFTQVRLFALACKGAASVSANDIRDAALGLEFESPAGPIKIDRENQHLWKRALIGQIGANGVVKVVWASECEIEPNPFPFPALNS